MKERFTPGPWVFNAESEECISPNICFTGDIGGFIRPEDGRLAASAPEMYKVLLCCEQYLCEMGCDCALETGNELQHEPNCTLGQVQTVLAKARGSES